MPRTKALLVGVLALALVGSACGAADEPDGPVASRTPSPTAVSTPTADPPGPAGTGAPDPASVVDGPGAHLAGLAVAPGRPDTMAALWREGRHGALALTDDGFHTRVEVSVDPFAQVHAVPGDVFAVVEGRGLGDVRFFDADGFELTPRLRDEPAPVGADEVAFPVGRPGRGLHLLAIGADGLAHPVPAPDDVVVRAFGGRLLGLEPLGRGRYRYHWSDDGGATWGSADLSLDEDALAEVVPTPAGDPHAVVESADGATLFPLLGVHQAAPDGTGWTVTPYAGARLTLTAGLVLAGEVRVFGQRWAPDGRAAVEEGAFRVSGSGATLVPSRLPDPTRAIDYDVVHVVHPGAPVLWVVGPRSRLLRSDDGGATWTRHAAR